MRNIARILICLALSFNAMLLANCQTKHENKVDQSVVTKFDINRYLGLWYEIARYPHSFEKGLTNVTAEYTLRKDGKVKIFNKGVNAKGKQQTFTAKASLDVPLGSGNIKVTLFWFIGTSYKVMELDTENYQWALVGGSTPNYLWILSRTAHMDDTTLEMIKAKAAARGYDLSKLTLVSQARTK